MPWDPLGMWPIERRWIWLTLAFWLCVFQAPAFFETTIHPNANVITDFFQEYASARNRLEGLPVYTSHTETAPRYLGRMLDQNNSYVLINGHPPTSVMLAFPFARLEFQVAFATWNLISLVLLAASLWLVIRELEIPFSPWSLCPITVLLLLCHPLREQLSQGQLNLILLPLITGAWAAERSGRPRLAGTLLGSATAIKLFPGFLLLYYAWRGKRVVVLAGLVMLATLTVVTVCVLGWEAYRSYFLDALPAIRGFQVGWDNASLWGFWSRLFEPAPEKLRLLSRTEPLWYSPTLARVGAGASSATVVGVLAWVARGRNATCEEQDLTFGLAAIAMVLISPIAWEHYFLLLLLPLSVVWLRLPPVKTVRATFFLIVTALLWVCPAWVWTMFGLGKRAATPVEALGVFSFHCYALLGLFALGLAEVGARRRRHRQPDEIYLGGE